MDFQNFPSDQTNNDEETLDEQQQPQKRINASPRNNIYAPGTGPGTKTAAVRTGTLNRDGSTSPVDALGAATGSLSQPLPHLNSSPAPANPPGQPQNQQADNSTGSGTPSDNTNNGITGGLPSRPGRINAAPRNNIYAPGTGPGTKTAAVRTGTLNRDGTTSPVDALGAATGPLSQPTSRWMTPRPTPAQAFAQRQSNVDQAKANGTFDAARAKFNAANPGHSMDESGTITQRGAAAGTPTPLFFKARQPAGATASAPATPAQQPQFASAPNGQGGSKMVKLPAKPAPAAPAPATPPAAPRPPLATAAGPAPAVKSALTINIPSAIHTGAPKPPLAAAGQAPAGKPALSIHVPSATPKGAAPAPAPTPPTARAPATFENQSRDKFFGDAQKRQGVDNAYSKAAKGAPASTAPPAQPGTSAPDPTQKNKRK